MVIYYIFLQKINNIHFKLGPKNISFKKIIFWCCRPLNLADVGHKKKKISKALNYSNCHKILCYFLLQHKPTTTLNETI